MLIIYFCVAGAIMTIPVWLLALLAMYLKERFSAPNKDAVSAVKFANATLVWSVLSIALLLAYLVVAPFRGLDIKTPTAGFVLEVITYVVLMLISGRILLFSKMKRLSSGEITLSAFLVSLPFTAYHAVFTLGLARIDCGKQCVYSFSYETDVALTLLMPFMLTAAMLLLPALKKWYAKRGLLTAQNVDRAGDDQGQGKHRH